MTGFFRHERLLKQALTEKSTVRETFRQIGEKMNGYHGYLAGVEVCIDGYIQESAAAHDLSALDIWNLITHSLTGLNHEWLRDMPGSILNVMNVADETIKIHKDHVLFNITPIPSSASPTRIKHSWIIPIAQKLYQPNGRGKGNKDGMFPLAAMKGQGEYTAVIGELPGNWGISASGIEITVNLLTYWTKDKFIPSPWRGEWFRDDNSRVQFADRKGRMDWLIAHEANGGVYVVPDGRVRLELDGVLVQSELTGQDIVDAANARRDEPTSVYNITIAPLRYLPLIMPTDAQSRFDQKLCSQVRVEDAQNTHGTGHTLYARRLNIALTDAQTDSYAAVLGIDSASATDPKMLSVSKRPAGSLGLERGELAAIPVRVD